MATFFGGEQLLSRQSISGSGAAPVVMYTVPVGRFAKIYIEDTADANFTIGTSTGIEYNLQSGGERVNGGVFYTGINTPTGAVQLPFMELSAGDTFNILSGTGSVTFTVYEYAQP